ncbi:MAG: ABC transporter ATP-binding protein, partial [Candidatus Heimdallarchaeota archaeon]
WDGNKISFEDLKTTKGNVKTQIVFQNPYSSLSPRIKLGEAAQHPLVVHGKITDPETRKIISQSYYSEVGLLIASVIAVGLFLGSFIETGERSRMLSTLAFIVLIAGIGGYIWFGRIQKGKLSDNEIQRIFDLVGLAPPDQYYNKYPHEVSGGERQRVAIARSIVLHPKLLILDEPTSMLDVSLRAGILDLLETVKESFDMSILFITHDLATARHFGDRIGVMYAGKIVENGSVDDLFNKPLHPYTKALIDAIPSPTPRNEEIELPKGDVPDSINPPPGCRFKPRCVYAKEICSTELPPIRELELNHFIACHYPLNQSK